MKKTVKKDIEYYMSLPYTIEIIKYPDGGFFARVKELEGCMTEGDTLEEVYEMIEDAKRAWIETALEEGIDIPLPESIKEEKYSGRILLRLPKDLHKRLAESAKKEGVSINTYIVSLLSEKSAERTLMRNLKKNFENIFTFFIREFHENIYKDALYLKIETELNSEFFQSIPIVPKTKLKYEIKEH